MVARGGFYEDGETIHFSRTEIEWDLGFDKIAKYGYIGRLHDNLKKSLGEDKTYLEVTSASPLEAGRLCSPIYIPYDDTISMEDWWHTNTSGDVITYGNYSMPASLRRECFIHMYCVKAKHMIPILREIDVFTDVFFNPDKASLTQAEACAVLKLLDERHEYAIIRDTRTFIQWLIKHGRRD